MKKLKCLECGSTSFKVCGVTAFFQNVPCTITWEEIKLKPKMTPEVEFMEPDDNVVRCSRCDYEYTIREGEKGYYLD